MNSLIHILTNIISQNCARSREYVVNAADPTSVEEIVAYFVMGQELGKPADAEKHEGRVCKECGCVVRDDRCACTDYSYPRPECYEIKISIPCWVTDVQITARTSGHTFRLIWDNMGGWSRISSSTTVFWNGAWVPFNKPEQAEKLLHTILSQANFGIEEKVYQKFEVITYGGHYDESMENPEAER